jgi:hypothetical protein
MNQEIRDRIVEREVDIETVKWLSLLGVKNNLTMTGKKNGVYGQRQCASKSQFFLKLRIPQYFNSMSP